MVKDHKFEILIVPIRIGASAIHERFYIADAVVGSARVAPLHSERKGAYPC